MLGLRSLSLCIAAKISARSAIYLPMRRTLDQFKLPPDMEQAWLIRAFCNGRFRAGHERNYRIILGSQIQLLLCRGGYGAASVGGQR
jgi:hypothetical protein